MKIITVDVTILKSKHNDSVRVRVYLFKWLIKETIKTFCEEIK